MKVKVERYNGERALERGIRKMAGKGWQVQSQQSRKRWWRFLSGFLTRQQVHTVTFVQYTPEELAAQAAQQNGQPAPDGTP